MREIGVREARATLTELLAAAAVGNGTRITRHGLPVAVLLPPEAAAVWEAHLSTVAERARRQVAADARRERREAWENELVHPVAAVVRWRGHEQGDDPLYLAESEQVPQPRRELRALVQRLQPDLKSWLVEAWYEEDPRRPSPSSARFRNTVRHRYDWQGLVADNVLHVLDAAGETLARAEYEGEIWMPDAPEQ